MIDFFFKLGVVFIGLSVFILITALALMAGLSFAIIIDDWWRERRYRALQRHHDLRIEK